MRLRSGSRILFSARNEFAFYLFQLIPKTIQSPFARILRSQKIMTRSRLDALWVSQGVLRIPSLCFHRYD